MSENKRGPFRVEQSRTMYSNPWLQLREDRVVHSSGREGVFGIVEIRAGSTVLALNSHHEAYVLREFKYALGRMSLELMSGGLEESELPLTGAQRELREELGLVSEDWMDLGLVHPFTSIISSPNHLFVAFNVSEVEATPDEWEAIEVTLVPFDQLLDMVLAGEITHAASCVCVLKAARLLQGRLRQ